VLRLTVSDHITVHVTGHRVSGQRFWAGRSGRVGWVSVTDPVSDPVFVVFARALMLFWGENSLHHLGICEILCTILCILVKFYYSVAARKFYLLNCGRSISAGCKALKKVDLIV